MKILLVAPSWVGDMVMAHTLVQVLVERHPGAHIHALAPAATVALAGRMHGIDAASLLDVGHGEVGWTRRREAAGRFRGFDAAYVLPNSLKSALVPLFARIPKRIGWSGEARYLLLNDRRTLDTRRLPLMVERFMALGLEPGESLPEPYPRPRLVVDEDNRTAVCHRLGLDVRQDASSDVVALCPGAEFGPAKRWSAAHYAEVAGFALTAGDDVWLFGSPGEAAVCAEIECLAPGVTNLAGRTSLLDAIDLMSLARTVVCNDSGLMHVACALERKVVAVYGSTSPGFTPPLGEDVVVLRESLDCSPCFERECPLGHMNCLNSLAPKRVIEALS
ncbi:MAG: lipopolysaccharide heptosyltransferase II [Pseudomonadales bacterium]|jgi:heptosyltransferase-2|nr:lipopolysaccharide heptosyltransferase II [Pseudomonadales bacterium]MDP6469525.1 lipopolysaccharide heptosyltransferase II [Pseudomonadales bacterium]MDP6827366.1 lipopolysaccharide heptosyltransferase II [Pseudomonadales bacterium]MDP6971189.1 lipopolysaccharide heptosyltransferase II [Pseudomonadales bacterium]|tara:strand:- start:2254 stop:3252 length:999 start_codon:yes stop_codon:yes gene_type:complete